MAWLIEAFNEETSIEESGTLHKAMIGLKMNLNNSREKIFKEDHGNKNMLAYVQKCNSIEDLEYLRKDAYVGIKDMQKTYENLKKVESGATPEKGSIVKGTYDFYQKEFIKKGITSIRCIWNRLPFLTSPKSSKRSARTRSCPVSADRRGLISLSSSIKAAC